MLRRCCRRLSDPGAHADQGHLTKGMPGTRCSCQFANFCGSPSWLVSMFELLTPACVLIVFLLLLAGMTSPHEAVTDDVHGLSGRRRMWTRLGGTAGRRRRTRLAVQASAAL